MSALTIGLGSGACKGNGMLLVALLMLVGLTGCSIDRRSGAFACESTRDCSGGRVCIDQLCVLPGSGSGDAGSDCPTDCTRCEGGTCYLDCTEKDCDGFDCPAGWKCNITCAQGRCSNIDCGASDCDLMCTGTNACDDVTCGPGRCNVLCTSGKSCLAIDCEDACSCQVTCDGLISCADIVCPEGCAADTGCSATATATCNTCS
jgi:hypothetical protein